MAYSLTIPEEELKNKIARDYFSKFDCTQIIGKIDFCVATQSKTKQQDLIASPSILWAESKRGNQADLCESFVQLILTIGKNHIIDDILPPNYLGAFDAEKIAFIEYHQIDAIFSRNDFNWKVTPSNHKSKEFKQLLELVDGTLQENSLLFYFEKDDRELKEFIKNNFASDQKEFQKIAINKNNFIAVYSKWREQVMPSIGVDWESAKKAMILDADFYLADLLSAENKTIKEKLSVLLKTDHYELGRKQNALGFFESMRAEFNDRQTAHRQFWALYERPPREEYWNFIIERRDLLVPQDFRERKGAFFTPEIWVNKSQEYIAAALGEDWQEEYYVWDCAAGTGNLLNGLTNKYNVWASTLDQADVDVMRDRIKNRNANLLEDHIFQFDFLNDSFDELPDDLKQILNDENKRRRLVIYINPPYAEVSSIGGGKKGLTESRIHDQYSSQLGTAGRELYALFLARIYSEIPECILAEFSKLKVLQGPAFSGFRKFFQPKLMSCFIVPASTFDNVEGDFPIGFKIWDLKIQKAFSKISADVYDFGGNFSQHKLLQDKKQLIGKWITLNRAPEGVGFLRGTNANDFQNNNIIYIANTKNQIKNPRGVWITHNNMLRVGVYLAVRQCLKATWLNDRDQFLFPNDDWEKDLEFQSDCLAYTLFHGQNRISCQNGTNHWIPFTESEVNSREKFKSNFMTDFIAGKIDRRGGDLFSRAASTKVPLIFSDEAKAVFDAGRELWRYYHSQPKTKTNPNASFYDIRCYFQGFNDKGNVNKKSSDEKYNQLIAELRRRMKFLAAKIEPKVYEHGFLLK